MPRPKFQTLTEQMFYILLCLKDECYGIDIFDKISALTGDQVTVGSGTLYNLLEQFLEAGMIREVKVEGRRRSYILTDKGREMLDNETQKLRKRVADYTDEMGQHPDASVFLRTHRDRQHGQAVSQAEEGIQRNKLRHYNDRRYRACRCFDGRHHIWDAVRCEKRYLPK